MRFSPPRFYYLPDGVSSASSADAALTEVFGGLDRIRPDLAHGETEEVKRKEAGKPPERTLELSRPLLDHERAELEAAEGDGAAATDEGKTASETAREAAPVDGEGERGSDDKSPDDDAADLAGLIAKYQGRPLLMANAIREMQSLQNKTAEEKKEAQERFDAAAAVLDNDYDWVDGKPVLKAEVAAKTLRARRANVPAPLRLPTEAQIRGEVEAQLKAKGLNIVEEEHIDRYMAEMKPIVDDIVKERMSSAKQAAENQRTSMQLAVGELVGQHLQAHPKDKDILPDIDRFYAGIPEEARVIALLEDWVPFARVAELVRIEKSLPTMLKEAYNLGKKGRGKEATITEAGSPGRSAPASPRGRGTRADSDAAFKERLINPTGLASLDSIVGSR